MSSQQQQLARGVAPRTQQGVNGYGRQAAFQLGAGLGGTTAAAGVYAGAGASQAATTAAANGALDQLKKHTSERGCMQASWGP